MKQQEVNKIRNCFQRFTRWPSAFLLLAILAWSLGSCTSKRDPNTLVIGTEKSVTTLDPRMAIDTYSVRATRLIFSGLFRIDENLKPVPYLASRYEISPDGLTYNIWLRSGVTFHDGTPLTVRDVTATYRYVLDETNKVPYRNSFTDIERMDVVGENQIRITLKKPYIPFLTALTMGVVPERFEKQTFETIGSGPYRVQENRGKEGLILKRYDNYFDSPVKIARIYLKPILDDSVRLLALLKGSIDLIQNAVPPTLLHKAREKEEVEVVTSDGLAYAYVGFNLEDPTLKNLKVRQAIAHAIDRDAIIQYKLKDLATPATTLLASQHYMANKKLPQYNYDPEMAKSLLDEAGYKDPDGDGPKPRLELTYKTSTNPERIEIAQVIVDQLKKVGIDVELRSFEWGVFFDDVKKGNFQIYTLEWSGITSEDIYHYVFHTESIPPNGANRGRFRNAEIDHLVTIGRTTVDPAKRQQIYLRVQEILANELPYVSLWHRHNITTYRDRLQGYKPNTVADYTGVLTSSLRDGAS